MGVGKLIEDFVKCQKNYGW